MSQKSLTDIEISNSGSGFFGIHGRTERGREWIDKFVHDAYCGEAWTDDRRCAMEIVDGALEAGMQVI